MSNQEEEDFVEEPDHEIFLGFESGAIAICRLSFDMKNEMKYDIVLSPFRLVPDPTTKHVLSMHAIQKYSKKTQKPEEGRAFLLAVGYYSKYV